MARATQWKSNFTSGELSGLLDARIETLAFANGLSKCENFIVLPQGPIQNRAGTEFIDELRDSSKAARLIPFIFNNEQAYTLCFNDGYIRFFADQGIVGAPYEITHPYADADLPDIAFTQSGDTMWLTHPGYKPRKLVRAGHTSWSISNYAPTADPFTGSGDYPAAVTIHEQRLVFGYTDNDPQKIFSSVAGNYDDMTTGTSDTAAFVYVLGTRDVNTITWLFSDEYLLIGTNGGIMVARGTGYDEAITATNIQIKKHVSDRAGGILPLLVKTVTMFISRLATKLYGLSIPAGSSRYASREATIRNPGISGTGISNLAYQEEPSSILWMVRADGQLLGVTLEFDEEVSAWHRHILGGSFSTGDAVVENAIVIPTTEGDELWLCVKRTVDGGTVRYIELMKKREEDDLTAAFFVDSGLTYSGAATDTLTGLDHLEGETVTVLGDGATHPDVEVSSGSVTLQREVTEAVVGLGYNATMTSMRLEGGGDNGPAQTKPKRIHELVVRVRKTLGMKYGPSEDALDIVPMRDAQDLMDEPPALINGDLILDFDGDWDQDGYVVIQQYLPLPMTIIGFQPRFTTNDK